MGKFPLLVQDLVLFLFHNHLTEAEHGVRTSSFSMNPDKFLVIV